MKKKSAEVLVFLLSLGTVFTASTNALAQDESSIRPLPIEKWCAAEEARDLDAKMSLFTTDVVFLVPGQPPINGLEKVRSWHESIWKGTQFHCTGSVDEVKVFGDWGFARGTFTDSSTDSSGVTEKSSGKFINIVRRNAQGEWKIARVIWNVD